MKAHLIERLKVLARANGGPEAVAEAAGVSAENLKQIISGTKLPSGEPRGVGPGLQAKLDKAFPGWVRLEVTAGPLPRAQPPAIAQAVEVLATALAADMRDDVREDVADALAAQLRRDSDNREARLVELRRQIQESRPAAGPASLGGQGQRGLPPNPPPEPDSAKCAGIRYQQRRAKFDDPLGHDRTIQAMELQRAAARHCAR